MAWADGRYRQDGGSQAALASFRPLASLRRLWAVHTMAHSARTFSMPRRRNWRKPRGGLQERDAVGGRLGIVLHRAQQAGDVIGRGYAPRARQVQGRAAEELRKGRRRQLLHGCATLRAFRCCQSTVAALLGLSCSHAAGSSAVIA